MKFRDAQKRSVAMFESPAFIERIRDEDPNYAATFASSEKNQ